MAKKGGGSLPLIKTRAELKQTLRNFHNCRKNERDYYSERIKKGICFIRYTKGGKNFFAPSRFSGYRDNTPAKHNRNGDKDGRLTNPAISRILEDKPLSNSAREREYRSFCKTLFPKEKIAKRGRKFWRQKIAL